MLNAFSTMLDSLDPQVFIGDTDAPVNGDSHVSAWDGLTHHVHFDPTPMNNLVISGPSSNAGWQVAYGAMHEAAHAVTGAHHTGGKVTYRPVHGGAPIYGADESIYFRDLNYGPNSCMK